MSEQKLPNLGEPGAPSREDAEAFAVSAVAFILRQMVARGQFPIVMMSASLDTESSEISVWPVLPDQNREVLVKLLREGAECLSNSDLPTETLDAGEVLRGFTEFQRRAEAERAEAQKQKGGEHAG